MMKYRRRPHIVEAVLVTNDTAEKITYWINQNGGIASFVKQPEDENGAEAYSILVNGQFQVESGTWIIRRSEDGQFFPASPGFFEKNYDIIEDHENEPVKDE